MAGLRLLIPSLLAVGIVLADVGCEPPMPVPVGDNSTADNADGNAAREPVPGKEPSPAAPPLAPVGVIRVLTVHDFGRDLAGDPMDNPQRTPQRDLFQPSELQDPATGRRYRIEGAAGIAATVEMDDDRWTIMAIDLYRWRLIAHSTGEERTLNIVRR